MSHRYDVTALELQSKGLYDQAVENLLANYAKAVKNQDLYVASALFEEAYTIQFRARQDIPDAERAGRLTTIETSILDRESRSERERIQKALSRDLEMMDTKYDSPRYKDTLTRRLQDSPFRTETVD